MKHGIAAMSAATAFTLLANSAFAAYSGWIAGGLAVYGTVANTPAAARQEAIDVCTEAEAQPCDGAFVLSTGRKVVTARCVSGDMMGFAVGETRRSVEAKIANSPFSLAECTLGE